MEYWRTCFVDGTRYEYCSHCERFNREETWRYIYCSENCMGIYKAYEKYEDKKSSAEEVIKEFENYKLPPMEKFHKAMQPLITEIYTTAAKDESGY